MAIRRDFEFTDRDFCRIRDLVKQHAGITLTEAKKDMVYSRLSRRLRHLGITSFSEYCQLVEDETSGELVNFTNSVTTNLTAFFREQHHFDYLSSTLLPRLRKEKADTRRLRIWSAGCSTGEEPYSIALYLLEKWPAIEEIDVEIVSSDIDSMVLERCRKGVYSQRSIQHLPAALLRKYFTPIAGGHYQIDDGLRDVVRFTKVNLSSPEQTRGYRNFDLIFCRNLLIYFDDTSRRQAAEVFYDALTPGGFIFLGHSESMSRISSLFAVRKFPKAMVYQKPVA